MDIIVIGGGVMGLCCSYYLEKAGHKVIVIDNGKIGEGCSYGNMGYVSPSHFIPLATPGIISQGIKWMMSASSPFYIKPRLDLSLMKWGYHFWKSTSINQVNRSSKSLNDLLQLSRKLTIEMKEELPESFDLQEKGVWMLYKNEETGHHEEILARQAENYGLKTVICDKDGVQSHEKDVEVDIAGGVLYIDDCHLHPAKFMNSLYQYLLSRGVKFYQQTNIKSIEKTGKKITKLIGHNIDFSCDEIVVANGSWMEKTAKTFGVNLLMQPGKGYSVEYDNLAKNLTYPSILVDDRVATCPIGNWLRIGGTMELSGHSNNILPKRVLSIYKAMKKYYPDLNISEPNPQKAWYGYRPVSPDGMPYIGRTKSLDNVSFAGGHAMLGISGAAGTGKLISEVISGKKLDINIDAYKVDRFQS